MGFELRNYCGIPTGYNENREIIRPLKGLIGIPIYIWTEAYGEHNAVTWIDSIAVALAPFRPYQLNIMIGILLAHHIHRIYVQRIAKMPAASFVMCEITACSNRDSSLIQLFLPYPFQ